MKKRSLLSALLLTLVALFAFSSVACDKEIQTLKSLQNEYGIVVDGGSFEEGSSLISNSISTTAEEAIAVLTAIAEENYNKEGSVYIFDIYVTKDGAKVQPDGKVTVSIPIPNAEVEEYLVFHIKGDNSVEKLIPTVANGKISFETSSFSYFVITEAVVQDAPPIHVHDFEWVEGKEPTCEEEGVADHYHCDGCGKNFDQNYGEMESIVIGKLPHDVGLNYSPRIEPTFFMEGTVAYYICNDCLQYISEDGQIIPPTDIFIPTLSLEISVCVNGVPTELALQGDFNGETAEWKAEGLSVKIGDVITVCLTDDTSYKFTFTCDGIVDEKGVVTAACEVATVDFYADRSSLHLVMLDPTVCVHNYVWVEGKEPTCEEEGVADHYHCEACGKNFDPNYGEMESISIPKAEHEYGSMYWGKSANFFEDGNIEYYQCSECEKYFDNEYNEVETPIIPKYSTNISICVNGVPTALVFAEQYEGHIIWTLDKLTVKEGDVITVCCTDNPDIIHSFSSFGIIDSDGKITMTAVAQVVVEATYNGLMLSINYIYEETYNHYIQHIGVKSYDMTLDESNPTMVFVKDVTLPAGSEVKIHALILPTMQDLSYIGATLVNTDQSIAVKQNGYFEILIDGTFDFYFDFEKNELTIVEGYDYEHYLNHIGVKSYDMIPYEYNPNVVFIESLTFDAGAQIKPQAKQLSTNQNISYVGVILVDTDESIAVKQDGYVEILKSGTYDFYFDFVKNELTIIEIYQGIVIEINGVQYPMNYVTYPDGETKSYIYGYVSLSEGDTFVIIDNVNKITYDFDDLSADYAWNTRDYHRGDNGEFVVDYSARYGIEFDYGGEKKIFINKVFDPNFGNDYQIKFMDTQYENVALEGIEIPAEVDVYNELLWYIAHPEVENNEDILSFIGEYGLWVYTATLYLEEGMKFNILSDQSTIINATHLTELYAENGDVGLSGSFVYIGERGYYTITYLPCVNSFAITREADPDVYIYCDEGLLPLTKDENNVVTYYVEATTSTYIAYMDYATRGWLAFTLDSETDSTVARVEYDEESDMSMLFFDKAGTYYLDYNIDTGVLSITSLGGDTDQGGDDEQGGSESIDDYIIFISVVDYTNGNQTLYPTKNPDNANELYIRVETIAANSYLSVSAMSKADYSSTTYSTLADTDASVATNLTADLICVKVAGPIEIYFNFETKTIRIVAVS